jgi:hypothetical protein
MADSPVPLPNQYEKIRVSTDFILDAIKLYPWNYEPGASDPIDLTNVRGTLNIYEDIFNNFLTGDVQVLDAWDLPMLYPIIGEELLELIFRRPGTGNDNRAELRESDDLRRNYVPNDLKETEPFSLFFRVTKLSDRKLVRDKTQSYKLHFVSAELIANKKKKVRRAFAKMLYSDMVEIVYNDFILMPSAPKAISIHPTMYEQDFVAGNWTPAQTINIISSRSLPEGYKGSNYVFYETLEGFYFQPLELKFEGEVKEALVYQVKNVWLNSNNKNIEVETRNIEEYEFSSYFDVVSNLQNGMYASKLLTYDLVRQRYFEYDFDYIKEFDKQVHLAEFKICTDGLDALGEPYLARFNLMSTNKDHDIIPWIASKEPGILPMKLEEYVLPRQSQFQQLNNNRITITISGNTERRIGDIIEFVMPSALNIPDRLQEPEKYLSGKYIIMALRHRLEVDAYYQDIELVKDSFLNAIVYEDPIPLYKNVF